MPRRGLAEPLGSARETFVPTENYLVQGKNHSVERFFGTEKQLFHAIESFCRTVEGIDIAVKAVNGAVGPFSGVVQRKDHAMESFEGKPRRKNLSESQKRELGLAGERLAAELLKEAGFTDIILLNEVKKNHPFADVLAVRDGKRHVISVKARNRYEYTGDKENSRFKLGGVNPPLDGLPICRAHAARACAKHNGIGAWVIIRYEEKVCDAYFGTLELLDKKSAQAKRGLATGVLTHQKHLRDYEMLAKDRPHGLDYDLIRNYLS